MKTGLQLTALQYLALKHMAAGGAARELNRINLWPLHYRGLVVWPKRGTWQITQAGRDLLIALEDAAVKPPPVEDEQ